MLFSSVIFIFKFLPLALLIYFLLIKNFLKNLFLLIISLIFYAWGEPVYVILMMVSIIVNYFFGVLIERTTGKKSKWAVTLGVLFNVLLLVYYKYFWFITQNLNAAFGWNIGTYDPLPLPIGISFYTFQSLSYLIDVYRREVKAQNNILYLGLYISFFPQLIAGPIVRYIDVNEQIEGRKVEWNGFVSGVERFVIGLSKKVLLANTLGQVSDKIFFTPSDEITTMVSWLGIICYAFQIFFDFSGYSDMAIGLGRMFGFSFLENFNFPYMAKSIKDFWRRWHISLSTWFRDYLYIPLGGNRGTVLRTYINLIIVFFVTGLWHGASWNFVIWGLFHGFFLILERNKFGDFMEKCWTPIRHLYALLVILIAWVFFKLETFGEAVNYIKMMIGMGEHGEYPLGVYNFIDRKIIICLLAATLFSTSLITLEKMDRPDRFLWMRKSVTTVVIIGLLVLSIASIASETYNPFIYFRF
ncbi:MAG: MBOAT family O-acyltransferase [Bacteroidota bacterium]